MRQIGLVFNVVIRIKDGGRRRVRRGKAVVLSVSARGRSRHLISQGESRKPTPTAALVAGTTTGTTPSPASPSRYRYPSSRRNTQQDKYEWTNERIARLSDYLAAVMLLLLLPSFLGRPDGTIWDTEGNLVSIHD